MGNPAPPPATINFDGLVENFLHNRMDRACLSIKEKISSKVAVRQWGTLPTMTINCLLCFRDDLLARVFDCHKPARQLGRGISVPSKRLDLTSLWSWIMSSLIWLLLISLPVRSLLALSMWRGHWGPIPWNKMIENVDTNSGKKILSFL